MKAYIVKTREANSSDEPELVQFYTHESYPQLDWKGIDEEEGLFGIKLEYTKSFFGWNTLSVEAQQIEKELSGLATLDIKYYKRIATNDEYYSREQTIFVIRDYGFVWSEEHARVLPQKKTNIFFVMTHNIGKIIESI